MEDDCIGGRRPMRASAYTVRESEVPETLWPGPHMTFEGSEEVLAWLLVRWGVVRDQKHIHESMPS